MAGVARQKAMLSKVRGATQPGGERQPFNDSREEAQQSQLY